MFYALGAVDAATIARARATTFEVVKMCVAHSPPIPPHMPHKCTVSAASGRVVWYSIQNTVNTYFARATTKSDQHFRQQWHYAEQTATAG